MSDLHLMFPLPSTVQRGTKYCLIFTPETNHFHGLVLSIEKIGNQMFTETHSISPLSLVSF